MPMASRYGNSSVDAAIETPCVEVCVIDQATALCTGCGRSLAEIASWSSISREERRRIMDLIAERNAAVCKKVNAE